MSSSIHLTCVYEVSVSRTISHLILIALVLFLLAIYVIREINLNSSSTSNSLERLHHIEKFVIRSWLLWLLWNELSLETQVNQKSQQKENVLIWS